MLMAQTPLPLRFREAPDVPVIGLRTAWLH
jgi:hypothetical protein